MMTPLSQNLLHQQESISQSLFNQQELIPQNLFHQSESMSSAHSMPQFNFHKIFYLNHLQDRNDVFVYTCVNDEIR